MNNGFGRDVLVLPLIFFGVLLTLAAVKAAFPHEHRAAIPEELR